MLNALDTMPHFEAGEKAVLGACLIDNSRIPYVIEALAPTDFYLSNNRDIFNAIQSLAHENEPVDFVTLPQRLTDTGKLEQIGGVSTIVDLSDAVPSAANVAHYVEQVKAKAELRYLIQRCRNIAESGIRGDMNRDEMLVELQRAAFDFAAGEGKRSRAPRSISDLLSDVISDLEDKRDDALPTGFYDLDHMTGGGFRPGELIVICGRPGMGKTSFALDLVKPACTETTVMIFSMEMSAVQIGQRLVAKDARVDIKSLRSRNLSQAQWDAVMDGIGNLSEWPLFVDEVTPMTPRWIAARLREVGTRHQRPVGLVILDYLQLMKADEKSTNRDERVGSITRDLKLMARELGLPVVLLAQLNRQLEARPITNHGRRPQASDLRESGSIEQDADIIIGLYRAEEYFREAPEVKGLAEAIVLKQRNGPTGIVKLLWDAPTATFKNPAPSRFDMRAN